MGVPPEFLDASAHSRGFHCLRRSLSNLLTLSAFTVHWGNGFFGVTGQFEEEPSCNCGQAEM